MMVPRPPRDTLQLCFCLDGATYGGGGGGSAYREDTTASKTIAWTGSIIDNYNHIKRAQWNAWSGRRSEPTPVTLVLDIDDLTAVPSVYLAAVHVVQDCRTGLEPPNVPTVRFRLNADGRAALDHFQLMLDVPNTNVEWFNMAQIRSFVEMYSRVVAPAPAST